MEPVLGGMSRLHHVLNLSGRSVQSTYVDVHDARVGQWHTVCPTSHIHWVNVPDDVSINHKPLFTYRMAHVSFQACRPASVYRRPGQRNINSRAGLATATILPVAVLNCAHFLDSAFDVACVRAKRGGKLLANILMHRLHGDQPVTLLGVSVGARLVYHCCLELYQHGACTTPLTL
jgi:hypothetical protein